jgi:phage-related protein
LPAAKQTPSRIRSSPSHVSDSVRGLANSVPNTISGLSDNVASAICSLTSDVPDAVNGFPQSACDTAEEPALALLFVAASERVVEGVGEVS